MDDPGKPVETVKSERGRIDYIDGIRGVGALLVAVQHPLEQAFPSYKQWSIDWFNLGRVGIVAFFLVSGYVVGLTLFNQSVRTFGIRRFWRLYPTYWLATAVYAATLMATGESTPETTAIVVLINISMLQGFIGVTSILGVAWTLGIEVVFYLQSMLGKLARRLSATVWIGLFWLSLCAGMAGLNYFGDSNFTGIVPLMMFTASLGFSLYLWERSESRALISLGVLAGLVVPAVGWMMESRDVVGGWSPLSFGGSYIGGLLLFLVFYRFRARATPRPLLWLGAMSYALYLIHPSAMTVVEGAGISGWPFVLVVLVVSLAAAWSIHRFFESRMISIGRRLSRAHAGGTRQFAQPQSGAH